MISCKACACRELSNLDNSQHLKKMLSIHGSNVCRHQLNWDPGVVKTVHKEVYVCVFSSGASYIVGMGEKNPIMVDTVWPVRSRGARGAKNKAPG